MKSPCKGIFTINRTYTNRKGGTRKERGRTAPVEGDWEDTPDRPIAGMREQGRRVGLVSCRMRGLNKRLLPTLDPGGRLE